jgi:hypothetical protein
MSFSSVRLELEWNCTEAHRHLPTDIYDFVTFFVVTYLHMRHDMRLPH